LPNQAVPFLDGLIFLRWLGDRRLAYPSGHGALNSKRCFDRVLKRYNKGVRIRFLIVLMALLAALAVAQDSSDKAAADKPAADKAASDKAAASDREAEESSSRNTRIDLSPPKDDAKNHPSSKTAVVDLVPDNPDTSGIQEFHPWNPLKASKDVDIGNFYFIRKNYHAALERYKEALYYKDGDALASFRVAVCQEKLGDKAEAKTYYEKYLKIQPQGPFAKEARASLERLAKAQ